MKKHYIYRCVAVLLLAVALSVTAFAAGETVIDWETAGSVTLTLADSNDQTPVAGAEITIYQVAEAGSRDSQLVFTFTKDFAGCGLSLDDLNALYSERIFSRITSGYTILRMTGDDIRIKKKLMGR